MKSNSTLYLIEPESLPERKVHREKFAERQLELISRRGAKGPSRLLLKSLNFDLTGKALVFGDLKAYLAHALKMLFPEVEVTYHTFEAYELSQIDRVSKFNSDSPIQRSFSSALPGETSEYQTIFLGMPSAGDKRYFASLLHESYDLLKSKGKIYAAVDKRGDRWLRDNLEKLYGSVSVHHQTRTGIVFVARKSSKKTVKTKSFKRQFGCELWKQPVVIESRPGNFSHGELDEGTLALSECSDLNPTDKIIDLGCGNGVIGIGASKVLREGCALLVDSNIRSVRQARENVIRNEAEENCFCLVGKDLACIPDRSIDRVLTNPPYFGNFSISELFIREAERVLKPGGFLYLVTKAPEETYSILEEFFPESDIQPKNRRNYTVFEVQKN